MSVNPCRWINHWNNATPGLRLPSQRYQLILIGDREAHACEQLAWVIRESGTDDSRTRNFWVENANHYTTRPHDWQPIPTEFAVLFNSYNTTSNPRFSLKSGFLGRDMRIKIKLYVTTWRNFSHNLPNSCCCQVAFAENLICWQTVAIACSAKFNASIFAVFYENLRPRFWQQIKPGLKWITGSHEANPDLTNGQKSSKII